MDHVRDNTERTSYESPFYIGYFLQNRLSGLCRKNDKGELRQSCRKEAIFGEVDLSVLG